MLAEGEVKLGFAFAISLGLAVWSANSGMKAVIDALNVVYDEKEERGFIKLNAVSWHSHCARFLLCYARSGWSLQCRSYYLRSTSAACRRSS